MFNLVIKMEEGKIYEIVWDNGCFECSQDNCITNIVQSVEDPQENRTYENCRTEGKNEGINENENENTSDNIGNGNAPENKEKNNNFSPKFYITWFGTDKNKRQLKTAGLAMTKFKPYISDSFYSSVKGLFS